MFYLNPTAQARLKAQGEFVCEHCGNCCTQCRPITVSPEDLKRLANFFGKTEKITFRRHCKINPDDPGMIILKRDSPCKFYDPEKGCKIYEARPTVCRQHPFLSSEPVWSDRFLVPEHCCAAVKVYEKMLERGEIK
jgi:Fe-S-cluster containining protein